MLPSLVRKTLRDWRRAALGWTVGMAVFALIYVGFWASIRNNPELVKLKMAAMPKAVSSTFGLTDLTTGVGYLQGTVYALIGPLLLCMAAIILGARAIAGPEDAHAMDLLLANPISRRAFVVQRTLALLGVLAAYGAVLWLVPLALSQALDMGVSAGNVTATALGLFLMGLFFGMLALAAGAVSGRRSTGLAVGGAAAVTAYVIRGLSENVSWLHGWRWASPFHYYLGSDPLHHGLDAAYLAVLLAASVLLASVALVAFDRRDVRV